MNLFPRLSDTRSSLLKILKMAVRSGDILAASLSINILSLALPITLMQVYDRVLNNAATDTLTWLIVGCVTALFIETILRIARSFASGLMAARIEHQAGIQAVKKIIFSRFEDIDPGEVTTYLDRLNAVGTLRSFYSGQAFQMLLDLPFIVLFLYAIAYIGGTIVLFPLAVILVFFIIVIFLNRYFRKARNRQISAVDRRMGFIVEILNRIHTVKSVSMEEILLRKYENLQADNAKSNFDTGFWSILPASLGAMFSQLIIFGVIGIGASHVTEGTLTLGALTACSLLGARAMQPVQYLVSFIMRFSEARIAQERYEKIMELESKEPEDYHPLPQNISGWIELRNVSFRYDSEASSTLDQISLEVASNEMIGIHGASKSGTTTLLYLIAGLLQPLSGKVLIDSFDMSQVDETDLKGRIEYVSQSAMLFKGTLLENLTMFDNQKFADAMDAARLMGLDEIVAQLPMGYETLVNSQSVNQLSGGLVQRVAITRALVTRPRILLLDKTNTAMDRDTEKVFRSLIEQLKNKCTIIMVTHQPKFLALSDRVYELSGGHLEKSEYLELLSDLHDFQQ